MKKLIVAAVLILTTGILPSYTKQVTVKPTVNTIDLNNLSVSVRKDIGTAD